jgi:hypothetical protein
VYAVWEGDRRLEFQVTVSVGLGIVTSVCYPERLRCQAFYTVVTGGRGKAIEA